MTSLNPYIIIVIIIFIVSFVLILSWSIIIKEPPRFGTTTQLTTVGYGMRCTENPPKEQSTNPEEYIPGRCDEGLTCVFFFPDDEVGTCRKSIGSECNSIVECVPEAKYCFDGICSLTSFGGVNQLPPCLVPLVNVNGVCKIAEGGSCTSSNQCSTNHCVAVNPNIPNVRVCTEPKLNGETCALNQDCLSNFCDLSSGTGICQQPGQQTGLIGATCIYYQAEQQSTACEDSANCRVDLSTNNTNFGTCELTVYSWPSNTMSTTECEFSACIPPSICFAGRCRFPTDPLSCAFGTSSGECIDGYTCPNNTRCILDIQNGWQLREWVRSINSQMGYWRSIISLPEPGARSTLTTLNMSTGLMIIYSPNVSTSYMILNNNNLTDAIFIYNRPGDWLSNDVITIVPLTIRFIQTDTFTKVGLLVQMTYSGAINYFVLLADLPIASTLMFTLPTKASYTSIPFGNRPTEVIDFDLNIKGTGRLLYTRNNQQSFNSTVNVSLSVFPLTLSGFFILPQTGPKVRFITVLGTVNDINYYAIQQSNGPILIPISSTTIGDTLVNNWDISVNVITPLTLEVLYTRTGSSRLSYRYGENDVNMPIDANPNTQLSIGILDSTLSGSNVHPGLFILSN